MRVPPTVAKTVALACILVSGLATFAQKSFSNYGEITKDEQALTQCAFDKDAEAVVLLDRGESNYDDNYNLVTQRRIRIKVLKESGIGRGDVHIQYYSDNDFEILKNIEAVVINFDGQQRETRQQLDRKSIFNKKLNKYYSEISFALPNVKVGSIFEYRYESIMKNYGGLRDWVFQRDIPVVLSSYYLVIVPNAEFAYSVYKAAFMPIVVKPEQRDGSVLFEMTNLPGLREEKYIGAISDYLQKVKFQFAAMKRVENNGLSTTVSSKTNYTNTWNKLAREMLEERSFGTMLTKELPGLQAEQESWKQIADPYLRMKTIHDFVRERFAWNGIYSKFASDGLKNVVEKKTGTTGEINLILLNLLKAAGLEADPLLVSQRQHGHVDTSYPYLDQFSNVVAYVTLENANYILDGTDAITPSNMVPFDLLNTTGFVVNKKKGALLLIESKNNRNFTQVHFSGEVSPDGIVKFKAVKDQYEYAKLEAGEQYTHDKAAHKAAFWAETGPVQIDTFSVTGWDTDSVPLRQLAMFKQEPQKTGDYLMLHYNLFTGFEKNPFVAEQRFSDIDFGCTYTCNLSGAFTLPQNMVADALPKSLQLVMPDRSATFMRQVQQTGSQVQVSVRILFSKSLYYVQNYPELQAFYKQMVELLNEPILLKAKS